MTKTPDLPTVMVVKGSNTAESDVVKVVQFLKILYPDKTIEVSKKVVCLDIPPDAIQIIYPNGEEAIFAPDPDADIDTEGEKDAPPTLN